MNLPGLKRFVQFSVKPGSLLALLLIACCVFSGCTRQRIDAGFIASRLNKPPGAVAVADPMEKNLSTSYKESMQELVHKTGSIDLLDCNLSTKQYLKSIMIADFVYAAFSFQFAGGVLDTIDYDRSYPAGSMSAEAFYELGNSNVFTLDCGGRTGYFMALIDCLLGLKSFPVTNQGIHTFPLVIIDDVPYIIDPSHPSVMFDTVSQQVISYEEFRDKSYQSLKILSSPGAFGPSRDLVTRELYGRACPGDKDSAVWFLRQYFMAHPGLSAFKSYRPFYQVLFDSFVSLKNEKFAGALIPHATIIQPHTRAYRWFYLGEK